MEPRTHYQVSFTAKQALSLFVGLLVALALAYFFGLMTGLSGREPREAAAAPSETPAAGERAAAAAPETAEHIVFPAPVTAVAVEKPPAAPPAKVQPFEDREGEAPRVRAAAPPAARAPVAAKPESAASAGFRVQVVSVSSRAEADAEAGRLSRRGFPARVEPGTGPKGTIYRVRVGPFTSREDAARTSERLAAEGRRDTWIVPPSQ